MYGLAKSEAVREAQAVAQVIDGWKEHFAAYSVTSGDIDLYAEQIERPFLRDQRRELRTSANPYA
jgi:serine/threonine-protein kinase HipA